MSSFFRESNVSMPRISTNNGLPMKESLLTDKERQVLQQEQNNLRKCPEKQANWLSKITFQWLMPLLKQGAKAPLQEKDLYELPVTEVSIANYQRLKTQWTSAVQQGKKKPSLLWILCRACYQEFLIYGLASGFFALSVLLQPLLLNQMILYLEDLPTQEIVLAQVFDFSVDDDKKLPPPNAFGYFLVVLLLIVTLTRAFSYTIAFRYASKLKIQAKGALGALIYEEMLSLRESTRRQVGGSGKILNLQSTDIVNVTEFLAVCHETWSGPLMLFGMLGILWICLGATGMAASLGALVLLLGVSLLIAKQIEPLARLQIQRADQRVKKTRESLKEIKATKLYRWEQIFIEKIQDARVFELQALRRMIAWRSTDMGLVEGGAFFVGLAGLGVFAFQSTSRLSPAVVFTALDVLNAMHMPLVRIPLTIGAWIQSRISIDRLQNFLVKVEELEEHEQASKQQGEPSTEDSDILSKPAVIFDKATFSLASDVDEHEKDEDKEHVVKNELSNISIKIEQKALTMIIGSVGSGKSCLLQAILGELPLVSGQGRVNVPMSRIAFVSQQPWIINDTIRGNILLGSPLDEQKLSRVLFATCLDQDLEGFVAGLDTEVGERGVTLSGGQKQRVSIARALYAMDSKDLFIFDDCLSALDATTSQTIFERIFLNFLQQKACVLVTHANKFLPFADQIYIMDVMQLIANGSHVQLKSNQLAKVQELLSRSENQQEKQEQEEDKDKKTQDQDQEENEDEKDDSEEQVVEFHRIESVGADAGSLMQKESRTVGEVAWKTYLQYFQACTACLSCTAMFFLVLSHLAIVGAFIWISYWIEQEDSYTRMSWYINIAILIGVISAISLTIGTMLFAAGGLKASKLLHDKLLTHVIAAPMTFFYTTPVGRLVNRFSQDIKTIDIVLNNDIRGYVLLIVLMLGMMGTQLAIFPLLIIGYVVVALVYYYISVLYRRTSRELRRMENIARSPVLGLIDESLHGLASIRAYGVKQQFLQKMHKRLDTSLEAQFLLQACWCWLKFRLELMGICLTLVVALLLISSKGQGTIAASTAGLILTFAFTITDLSPEIIRTWVALENSINAVERIFELTKLEPEETKAKKAIYLREVDPKWPSNGSIVFENVKLRYRPDLDLVIKGISFMIKPKEKIAICGRTGSGKSTILQALYRLIEYEQGTISIDGISTNQLSLDQLRSKMAILPQEPVLFEESVRFNLDPTGTYGDDVLWEALRKVQLDDTVRKFARKLDEPIQEDVLSTFSHGEQQLFCLARALVRLDQVKIFLLDEATASIDEHTDAFVQESIRKNFVDCTVISIAHRLETIMQSDRVIVLSDGQVVEDGPPRELLLKEQPGGEFQQLASGHINRLLAMSN